VREAWLRRPGATAGADLLAIAVRAVDGEQRHVGVVHRREGDAPKLLHLAWHHDLRDEVFGNDYFSATPDLPEAIQRFLAGLCRRVAARYRDSGLPYGLRYDGRGFEVATGEVALDGAGGGLTCATFVLALFASYGVHLLDVKNWSSRSEDREWQEKILRALARTNALRAHIEAVRNDLGCARFRPEEVVAAAAYSSFPVSFADAQLAAAVVLAELLVPPPPPALPTP
jgi:hypothetical protein